MRALLRSQAIPAPRGLWAKAGQEWLGKVDLGLCQSLQRDQLLLELEEVRQKIAQVEKVLQQLAAQEPAVGLLRTIPGVGIRTAEAVVAYIDDPGPLPAEQERGVLLRDDSLRGHQRQDPAWATSPRKDRRRCGST